MLNTSKNDVPLYSQVKKECFTHEKISPLLCQREAHHTTSIANHTALRNRKKRNSRWRWWRWKERRKRTSSSKKNTRSSFGMCWEYIITHLLTSLHAPHSFSQLHCVFSYVYISQQNLLSSSQMAKWIVVDVTVRVVLFSTIAFVVNFLDNFFLSFLQQHHEGKICFSFLCIFMCYIRQLLGFFISHVIPQMIILMLSKMLYLREWKLFYRIVTILFFITCLNLDCFLQFYGMTWSH